ncbi:phospholipase D-like domain-containing protein [Mesorhizobium sp. M0998]|uniref:phospholipase D-like domain-containing protein n=1 Tax=Mesorhizobium sp. M0998 TaxID=2957044 RepID=UPI0033380459
MRDGRCFLCSGGLSAELVPLTGDAQVFARFAGQTVKIEGHEVAGRIEEAKLTHSVGAETAANPEASRFAAVFAAISARGAALMEVPNVVSVRPGYRRTAGHLTNEPAVVVTVRGKLPVADLASGTILPKRIGEVPVDVMAADPLETLQEQAVGAEAAAAAPVPGTTAIWRAVLSDVPLPEAAEAAQKIGYKKPTNVTLDACKVRDVLCHVGPDAGWPTLITFLSDTRTSLTVTMYEMTADYIVDELAAIGQGTKADLALVLQEDANETASVARLRTAWDGTRFTYAKAVVSGPKKVFANSFHSKVAVRDHTTMWLSSGNWSPHSQPQVPAGPNPTIYRLGNREWHVVINDAVLSGIFEKFIMYDLETAADIASEETAPLMPELFVPESAFLELEATAVQPAPFAPKRIIRSKAEPAISVQPLMTPDNYGQAILDLIGSARNSLFMQYSYIRGPKNNDLYRDLLKAVAERMKKGVDVRVIVDGRNEAPADVDLVLALGWDSARWRRQTSKVHNKGIIIDGQKTVVGSQNWSSDGTQINRDASLVFDDRDIAGYYDNVFQFDWANLTKPIGTQEMAPIIAQPQEPTPVGMVRVPWNAWYG